MFPPVPISRRVRSDTCTQLRSAVGCQADVRITDQSRERMAADGPHAACRGRRQASPLLPIVRDPRLAVSLRDGQCCNRLLCAASKRLERKHLPSPTRAYGDSPWRFRRPACATRWLATAAAHAASRRAGNSAQFRRIPRPPYIGAMLRDHGRRRSGRGSSLPDSCRAGWS